MNGRAKRQELKRFDPWSAIRRGRGFDLQSWWPLDITARNKERWERVTFVLDRVQFDIDALVLPESVERPALGSVDLLFAFESDDVDPLVIAEHANPTS